VAKATVGGRVGSKKEERPRRIRNRQVQCYWELKPWREGYAGDDPWQIERLNWSWQRSSERASGPGEGEGEGEGGLID